MVPGIQINTLIPRILADAKSKADYVVNATNVELAEGDKLVWGSDTSGIYERPVTPHAMQQLSTYLGIPSRFIDRLRGDAPDLITTNVNRLLQTKTEDRRMLRTLNGNVRAFLSDSYRRLDHEDVAERVLPMIQQYGYSVTSASITESRLYLHVVSPRTEGEVRKGDPVRFGWIISNSEVGMGSLSLQLFMERLVCTNGMVLPEFAKRRAHLGGRSEVAGDGYLVAVSSEAQKAADDALWLGVRDHVREFSTPAGISRVMERIREQVEAPVTGDPVTVVETLANKFLLREEEQKSVLYSFLENGDRTRWGLSNAITQIANNSTDYDRAVELERIGGNVLMLGGTEWRTVEQARTK